MSSSDRLVQLMALSPKEAVIVHNPSNMFYLTEGYTGEGSVFISAEKRVIITDFRYTEQAERQAPAFQVVMSDRAKGNTQWVASICETEGVSVLYAEDDYLTARDWRSLAETVGDTELKPLGGKPEKLREIKTPHEIECIRKACEITSKAFDELLPKIHEGMTEIDLRIELDFLQLKLGAEGNSFDTIVASGENGSLCHAIPGQRRLQKGDMITMDFGCKWGGYCSDMTRTVALGEPKPEMRRVYDTVLEIQQRCCKAVAPGKECISLHQMAQDFIDGQGYVGRFGHGLGHSVGIDIHENPSFNARCHDLTQPGMVITVEPGIYIPGLGGVRIEDTVLVTEDGWESLTSAPRELIIL